MSECCQNSQKNTRKTKNVPTFFNVFSLIPFHATSLNVLLGTSTNTLLYYFNNLLTSIFLGDFYD